MHLLIHDLEEKQMPFLKSFLGKENTIVLPNNKMIKHCIGCFGCWIKTPAQCIIQDDYQTMGEFISKCETLTIVSKCVYGGFSPFVKNVLDRSISYLHPYFVIKNDEMHHKMRYDNRFELTVCFYGETITQKENETAKNLVKANAINLGCIVKDVFFVYNLKEMREL